MQLINRLENQLNRLKNTLLKSGLEEADLMNNKRYSELAEQILTVNVVSERSKNVADLVERIKSIFDPSKSGITLASVYTAKGIEARRVFILGDALNPLKKSTLEWQAMQELNLIYVAYTRAQEELVFINDYDDYNAQTLVNINKKFSP